MRPWSTGCVAGWLSSTRAPWFGTRPGVCTASTPTPARCRGSPARCRGQRSRVAVPDMPLSADYIARETATNLWRNRLMTIAAVLTVAVSLALVGAALLLKQGAANAEVEWQRGTQVTVWIQPNASHSETAAIGTQLSQLPYVHACSFHTKAEDYNEAKKLLTTSVFSALSEPSTPPSFRCTPSQPQDAQLVINRFHGQPGVYDVTAPIQQIHTMEETITVLQWVFVAVALVLLLS